MSSLQQTAAAILLIWASAVLAQRAIETEGSTISADEDGVEELVREMREARAREPVVDRTIGVYSTHYTVGPQRFDSLEALLDHVKDYTPRNFPVMRLAECNARARMEELLAAKAELDRPYLERAREEDRTYLYEVAIGTPRECPW